MSREITENIPDEWKEIRLMKMDKALTEIDEAVEDAKASMPATVPKDTSTLAYWYGYATGVLYRIGKLANEGMTVPMEDDDDKT